MRGWAAGYNPITMVAQENIQAVVNQIAQQFQPDKVILFGSYAYGEPNEDSDVDLLVVMPADKRDTKKAIEIVRTLRPGFPMDLLVYDPQYLYDRSQMRDWFVREIVEKGKTLYERAHAGVG